MTITQLDIVLALSIISHYYNNFNYTYVVALIQIFQYMKDILHDDIVFCKKLDTKFDFIGYTDVDYS